MDSKQKELVKEVQIRDKDWVFPHLSMWINRMGNRSKEITQRSRSFLYLSLAVATATQPDLQRIYICENGVVSANLPISGQNIGTLLTRSTHPKFLSLFQQLICHLFDNNISIENPFIFKTKTEIIKLLKKWGLSELISATVSCSYTQGKTKIKSQCGTCSQCVGRRFSIISAGQEEHDRADSYEKNVFLDPLEEGRETAYAEGYIRTAFEISEMNDMQFFSNYPELHEIVGYLNYPPGESGKKLYNLFQKHAKEVIEVTTDQCNLYQKELLSGDLPDNCLISMLACRRHLQKPLEVYAEKIARILLRFLRIDFQSEQPESEKRVQESAEASLAAAKERLNRESPMLSYTVVQTKPDFSKVRDFNRLLFIEVKYLDSRSKLNRIVTEITSRITIYRDQGAFVLFVVYDMNDFIVDDERFAEDIEKHDGTKAIVVR